jgi:GT2 family glycosyltransferase
VRPAVNPLEAVIVTYCSSRLIGGCIDSIVQYAPAGTVIHVVDNASPDDTAAVVRNRYPNVRLVVRPDNSGFAVANNAVLDKVRSTYALVMNPDARLERGTVQHLLRRLEREPTIGIIGCRLLRADGSLDHAAKRFIPTPREGALYFIGRLFGRRLSRYVASEIDECGYSEVDAVSGAFMLIRTEALREAGLFDESYWMYGEDLELCSRFRMHGWKIVYDGAVSAVHIKGASAGIRSLKLNYEFHRSMARYFKTYGHENRVVSSLTRAAIWLRFGLTVLYDETRRVAGRLSP